MKTLKRFSVLLLAFSMLLMTGCWNYRELDNLSMVSGFAIDKGTQGFKYHLTIEFLDLSKSPPAGKLLETEGDTIFDGVRNALAKSQKKLFFSDCKVVVVSQDIAKEGLAPVFDWISRDSEPRVTINPVISKGKTAAELLQQKPITDQLMAMEIGKTISQSTTALSEVPNVELYQANNMLASEGTSLILPAAKVAESQSGKNFELDGTAVFEKDKLIGYLNREETKYLLFIKNQAAGGLLVTSPDPEDAAITLEIFGSQTSVMPEIKGDEATMKIDVNVKTSLAEDQTAKDYVTPDGLKKVEKSVENTLQTKITGLIKKVQEQYGSDIFGFGDTINRYAPDYWKKNQSKWEENFPKLKCTVTAHVTIENSATANTNIKVG